MAVDFVDLHVHSTFSVLDGHPEPDEIIFRAAELGRKAIALTDHGSVSGHVLFEKAVSGLRQERGEGFVSKGRKFKGEALDIKPIYGLEAYTTPDVAARGKEYQAKYHLSLLAKNRAGYQNMLKLVTRSWDEGFYYRQSIDGEMLLDHAPGLIVLSGCEKGNFMRTLERQEWRKARDLAKRWRSAFGDDFYIEVQHFPDFSHKAAWAYSIAEELGIKTVLTCDTHYLDPDGWRFQQFLWSIRDNKPVDGFKIEHAYLWEPDRLLAFCQEHNPGIDWHRVFENTVEVGQKVEKYALPRAPHVKFPLAGDKMEYIRNTVVERLQMLGLWDKPGYAERLNRELGLIEAKGYQDYFLVVADMILWAKMQGIFVGPARGSAAGSIVCYGLRITEVDPLQYGLIFERFIDETRTDLPDIDIDFEDDRRDEVFAYMEQRYGRENVARISTFARLGGRSVLDDAARGYRIPKGEINIIKRHLVDRSSGDQRAELTLQDTIDEFPEAKAVYERYPELSHAAGTQGRVRSLGKHAAGLVVTSEPVSEYVAIYKSGQERLIAVDWRDAAYLNLMKIDILGLKELSLLRIVSEQEGLSLEDIYAIPRDDPATLAGFNSHDYLGIFQYTGLATKGVASRIHIETLEQIADVNALARPGPLHSGSTEMYITGKHNGNFRPVLPQPEVQPIIDSTYGQLIYQEQIMRILREVGGLTWNDVCSIRGLIGKAKGSEAFEDYFPAWMDGCRQNGLTDPDAKQIWDAIRQFGKYGFNKAHSLSYGLLAYWSMYCKVHYPRSFYLAQLIKMRDKENIGRFLGEAMRKGIQFAPFTLDATSPTWHIDTEGRIAPGYMCVDGIGEQTAIEVSRHAPYADIADLRERTGIRRQVVNKGRVEVIEAAVGKSVIELFGLDIWEKVNVVAPERTPIELVNEGFTPPTAYLCIAGRVKRINKKNRVEEYKQKGKDMSKLKPGDPQDYVLLITEDETDSCMVYVSPEDYVTWQSAIWDCEDTYIKVIGRKMPGIQLVTAHTIDFGIVDTGKKKRAVPPTPKSNNKDSELIAS